jgi:hypothetical protein
MLYSKNGSIPQPETDGTNGWIEVPDMPEAPEGKEVVWWYPPGWVVRDPMPSTREGYVWKWSQTQEQWNEYVLPVQEVVEEVITEQVSTEQISNLTTDGISGLV